MFWLRFFRVMGPYQNKLAQEWMMFMLGRRFTLEIQLLDHIEGRAEAIDELEKWYQTEID